MWRRIIITILAALFALSAIPIKAGVSTDVVISANPSWGITSFTATVISDTQVDLEWVFAPNVTNVIIRAKYGSEPIDETDGYLVYSGTDVSVSDTSMNFDENAGILYYAAFGETAPGVYGSSASANAEGTVMLLLGLFAVAIALTIAGYAMRQPAIAVGAAGFWILVGFYAYYQMGIAPTAGLEVLYQALFWVCIGLGIVCMLEPAIMRKKATEIIDEEIGDKLQAAGGLEGFASKMGSMRNQLTILTRNVDEVTGKSREQRMSDAAARRYFGD